MPRKPSLRARRAVEILVENGGKSVSGAMRKAGYSAKTAKVPSKLTGSKSFQQLLDEYLPQDKIAAAHAALVEAEDVVFIPRGKNIIEKRRPDNAARNKAVEMAYKLRGNFAPEQIELTKRKYQNLSNSELAALIKQAKEVLLKQ